MRLASVQQNNWREPPCRLIVVLDLVKEGVPNTFGIGIPLAGTSVGGKRVSPQLCGTVGAVHRQVEAVVEKQFRPFPPGAELLHPAHQGVAMDQRGRHIGSHRAEQQAGFDNAIELADRLGDTVFRDVAKAGLEHEIELALLKRQIDNRSKPVELLQFARRPGMDRAVVFDTPRIDSTLAQRADELAARRSRYQKPGSARPVPDYPDQ